MEGELMHRAAYNGSKQFTQHDVPNANANGFGAAADDYMERGIDLNEQLILNKPATFFFRMNGDAMCGAGIQSGDVLIVDRSIKAVNGKIIVAAVNGDLVVRRFQQTFNHLTLAADNPKYASMELSEFSEFRAWGVVTCVIHVFEHSLLMVNSSSKKKSKTEDYRILY